MLDQTRRKVDAERLVLQLQFEFALWTRAMVRDLIRQNCGVTLSLASVGRLLRSLGLTPQRPVRRAIEQVPAKVREWLTVDYPAIQAKARNSLWRKSRIRPGPGAVEFRTLNGMAMGKRPAARQAAPMWVDTADLPTNDGHPYFEWLNRVLADSGFDAFVEELCAAFYADRLGRPSLRPGRYFRMLFIGYFEGKSSERGIAWRVADSLSLRSFLDLELTEAAPDHSTLSRTRRRIDVETHEAVFTWILERLSAAGLVRGKTVGIDATTLEANAAMRSIERRDTGESYEAFVRSLAEASGVETPTRADLARFDRSRKNKKTSNKEWKSPQDPDAKVAKMKDGRTHLAHKARARGRHGHGGHRRGDGAGCIGWRHGDAAGDADHGGRAGGVGAAGRSGGRGGGRGQGLPQRRDAGGARRGRGSESRIGAGARPALLEGQEDWRDAAGEARCAEGVVCEPAACPRAAGSTPATLPGRGGGAYFRAHV